MTKPRRRYTPEQRAAIVQEYREADPPISMRALAAKYDVHPDTVRTWIRSADADRAPDDVSVENRRLRAELARTQAELAEAREQCATLRVRYDAEHQLCLSYSATLRALEEAARG